MTDSKERPPGITITVPLSGPHRLAWATDAIDSIPLDEPRIAALHVVHSGGPWDWAPELRTRITRMPKVKVIEFPDRLELNESLTRVLSTVTTRWALLLPDDDAIVTGAMREGLRGAETALDGHAGLIAFGWQYLMDGRYRPGPTDDRR